MRLFGVSRGRPSRGMTLVELLVVMAIIGVLTAMLLPAVQQAREAARGAQCRSQLKQIGLALHNYESAFRVWPRQITGPIPGPNFAEPRGGWMTRIFPFFEQDGVYKTYDLNRDWHDLANAPAVMTPIEILRCPSAPQRDGFEWTVLVSYADAATTTPTLSPRTFFYGSATDYTNVGGLSSALNNSFPPAQRVADPANSGILTANFVRPADVIDGLSNTVLAGECAGRPNLYQLRKLVPDGTTPKTWSGSASVNRPFPTGGVWASHNKGFLIDGAQANGYTNVAPGPCAVNCSNDNEIFAFHPGGANTVLADGSVRMMSATISVPVLVAVITRAGGEVASVE